MVRGGLDTSISTPLYQAARWSQCGPMTYPDHTATGSTGHDPEATEATEPVRPAGGGSLRPVAVLAVGSFAMGTDSFVLAGILPNIAGGLHVSIAAAGQTITVFALTYALTAPLLAGITGALPRKPLMLAALGLFVLANLASAAAPTLALLLAARVAAGLGAALYTPNASAAAAALVSPARRGRALAMVLGGLTVGTVLGVPAGTAIGQRISWQASLVFVAVVGLVAMLGILATLPSLALPPAVPLRARFALLGNRRVLVIVAVMLLASAASISVYTYIAVVLAHTAHITGTTLAAVLLVWGCRRRRRRLRQRRAHRPLRTRPHPAAGHHPTDRHPGRVDRYHLCDRRVRCDGRQRGRRLGRRHPEQPPAHRARTPPARCRDLSQLLRHLPRPSTRRRRRRPAPRPPAHPRPPATGRCRAQRGGPHRPPPHHPQESIPRD